MTRTESQPSQVDEDPGARPSKGGRADREATRWMAPLAVASVAVLVLADVERAAGSWRAGVQLICALLAALWVVFAARDARSRRGARSKLALVRWLPAAAIVAVACALRYRMLAYLPLPNRTAFEELQMGADAYRLLVTHLLPLEFRFTKMIAAFGLLLGGHTVDALRLPFQLLGYAKLVVVVLCLRGLKVGWWPTAFVTVAAGVSRWFVIGSGVAYEDFSPIIFMLLVVWCLIEVDLARPSAAAWAAGAGSLAGILMFENSSFRFVILLAGGWLLWLALRGGRPTAVAKRRRWRPLAFFVVTLALVAAPMIVDAVHAGRDSIFFEAFVRYAHERTTVLASAFWPNLKETFATLAGRPVRISFYLAPDFGHAVHPLLGALLILGFVAGLVRPRLPVLRAVAVAALLAILVCCAATNYFGATRIAPVFSLLILAAGALLEDIREGLGSALSKLTNGARAVSPDVRTARRGPSLGWPALAGAAVFVVLSLWVVEASSEAVRSMAADRDVRNEYVNDQYVTASYLARTARPGGRVVVFTVQGRRNWSRDGVAYWVYASKALKVESVPALPGPDAIPSGTLVVVAAEGHALAQREVGELTALGRLTGSLETLDVWRGLGGRPLVASICVGCGAGSGGGS
jgi:hypothetical protein